MNTGVISIGLRCPIIKQGDDIRQVVVEALKDVKLNDKDVVCITESVVARSQGNYVTVDEIVEFLKQRGIPKNLILYSPIMSRNRFSIILKAFARYANKITILCDSDYDEQGNPVIGVNRFTGVNILDYYSDICKSEKCRFNFVQDSKNNIALVKYQAKNNQFSSATEFIDCRCHPDDADTLTLKDIMNKPILSGSFNSEYGLLGSNKATEEKLKLFPEPVTTQTLVENIQKDIRLAYGVNVEVMVYGDGCFKDPVGSIWEFADPVTSPAYTKGLEGTPNEIKIKAFADDKYQDLRGDELTTAIKKEIAYKDQNLVGNMASQGTTPRRYVDLLASLADLTSGSGDKGTPIVLIKNYFNNYTN